MTLVGVALAVAIAACAVALGEYLGHKDAKRLQREYGMRKGSKDV